MLSVYQHFDIVVQSLPLSFDSSKNIDRLALSIFERVYAQVKQSFFTCVFLICQYIAICYINDSPVNPLEFIENKRLQLSQQQFTNWQMKILEMIDFRIE
ncbi:Cyclin-like_superfamily [Hexamita inflata]|uniref:Cyclin-like superfamily n=1 Tax=Hexamita inflata TaxID=28002 RepID=A0AA86R069_9EUKA|nr:Cyclin-like superfamily [Hexamita inflata]CAI9960395.1 Cyclin-like superfamily [Hexamita inflata]